APAPTTRPSSENDDLREATTGGSGTASGSSEGRARNSRSAMSPSNAAGPRRRRSGSLRNGPGGRAPRNFSLPAIAAPAARGAPLRPCQGLLERLGALGSRERGRLGLLCL